LRAVIEGLPETSAELADRFAGPLTFGTSGMRGRMRAGPNGMNLAVIRKAAAGLVAWLADRDPERPLVIGYDGRRHSAAFAEETARVAAGAGRRALVLPRVLPTPVLAHAVRALDACAGVMITASHNPPEDNGFKVYFGTTLGGPGGAGALIISPADIEIEASIRAVGPISQIPASDDFSILDEAIVKSYVDGAVGVLDPSVVDEEYRSELVVAYTAMHGVGDQVLASAFAQGGFAPPSRRSRTRPFPRSHSRTRRNPGPWTLCCGRRRRRTLTSRSPTIRTRTGVRWRFPPAPVGGCSAATRLASCSATI
jgi:phosphomannomutase